MTTAVQSLTIATSAQVTGVADLQNTRALSLHCPVIPTSCDVFLLASPTSGGTYTRVYNAQGSLWSLPVATGSISVTMGPDVLGGIRFAKLEAGVPQESDVNMTLLCRL